MQVQGDPTIPIQNFLLAMAGLSVATERVTEVVKQWLSPNASPTGKGLNAATVQGIAILSGIVVTALSTLNPLNIQHAEFGWRNPHMWLNWITTGILVSGGSAVWNHLLDILQAAKVQKEQQAYGTAPAAAPQNDLPPLGNQGLNPAPAPAGD